MKTSSSWTSSFEMENVTMVEQLIKRVAYINAGFNLVKKKKKKKFANIND